MRYSRPPLNGTLIRDTRLRLGLTQEEVQQRCADLKVPVYNLSRIESGNLTRPALRVLPVLAKVLGLEVPDLLAVVAVKNDEPAGQVAA